MPATAIDAVITSRMSVRAFVERPVGEGILAELLQCAAAACRAADHPVCKVHVLQGRSRASLSDKACAAHDAARHDPALAHQYREQYDYYPQTWVSPFIERRRENGWGLYGLLSIGKGDKDRMHAQHQRNYLFFGAPVGLVFTMKQSLDANCVLRCGMFVQSVMLAARARGLDTCPHAAWNVFASIVLPHVGAAPGHFLVCCMSLGYADRSAPVNAYVTPRLPVSEFARWLD